jgi:hypothetical protein
MAKCWSDPTSGATCPLRAKGPLGPTEWGRTALPRVERSGQAEGTESHTEAAL